MSEAPSPETRQGRPWYLLTGLLLGLVLGLFYAWKISPVRYVDTDPAMLRLDFKDQYRLTIALAYLSTGNLERAQARLALLGDGDPVGTLREQAQRWLAQGDLRGESRALLTLATALDQAGQGMTAPPPSETPLLAASEERSSLLTPVGTLSPTQTPLLTPSSPATRWLTPPASPTPRPTRTPTPTPGAPFRLVEHKTVCDSNLPEGLLQIEVRDGVGRPLAGVEIVITWPGGEEHFFTGLKPEVGDGYADYQMTPGILYALQLKPASTLLTDLSAPSCREQGEEYWGSLYLSFEQR